MEQFSFFGAFGLEAKDTKTDPFLSWFPIVQEETHDKITEESDFSYGSSYTTAYKFNERERFRDNVEAIKLLKQIESEDRPATRDEQEVLAKYVGWGGLSAAFDSKNVAWEAEYKELRLLLTEDEYKDCRANTTTAFYTSRVITSAMYTYLSRLGFDGGTVLDPCMGISNFYSDMPVKMKANSKLYGVEIDSISGRISKLLQPSANIQICGFEKTNFADNSFDLVIGNVPFGEFKVFDARYNAKNYMIHDYFFAKAVDLARPGGIVAFITSKGTMDKKSDKLRQAVAEKCELLGAIRLPDIAFSNANTKVSTDIIFLKKREELCENVEDRWIQCGPIYNSYYDMYPENMLGKMVKDTRYGGEDSTTYKCIPNDDFNLEADLAEAITRLPIEVDGEPIYKKAAGEDAEVMADPEVKNGCYTVVGNSIYYKQGSVMKKCSLNAAQVSQIRDYIELRDNIREMLDAQAEGVTDEELAEYQEAFTFVYDCYVMKYGYISANQKSAIARMLRKDADYELVKSLEIVDDEDRVTKADIFTKRIVSTYEEVSSVDSGIDALHMSINLKGCVDIPYMLSIYNVTREQLIKELQQEMFLNPVKANSFNENIGWESAEEYLTGYVKDKLEIAKAFAARDERYNVNVKHLELVQPEDIPAEDIEVSIGATWITAEDYTKFLYELLDTPVFKRVKDFSERKSEYCVFVDYSKAGNVYFVNNKRHCYGTKETQEYGVKDSNGSEKANAYDLFEKLLNKKAATIYDTIEVDGKQKRVINKECTAEARMKQDLIKQAFADWIFADAERRERYTKVYNELFNNVRPRVFDGSHLTFPGMSPSIELMQHQKNAVSRILHSQNTLLSHCVGAGKTFVMCTGIMELKRIGVINKALFVVPNHLVFATASEFLRLYPGATLLVATKNDLKPDARKAFLAKMALNNYDAIIMAQSSFERVGISPARHQRMLEAMKTELIVSIDEIKRADGSRWSVKNAETELKKIEEKIQALAEGKKKTDILYFEQLGVDALIVDEAHNYKNLSLFSKMNCAGITTGGSQKAFDLYTKIQYMDELAKKGKGGRVVLATGTPVTNTIGELFVMMKYLNEKGLRERDLGYFDNWASTFGEVTTSLELRPEGSGFQSKDRFAKFVNVPELMSLFRMNSDIITSKNEIFTQNVDLPELATGAPIIVKSERNACVNEVMKDFAKRAERIHAGMVDSSDDNFLKLTHEARLLGCDPRLLGYDYEHTDEDKLMKVVNNIYDIWRKSAEKKGTQLVFSDVGTPKSDGRFTVYNFVKDQLVLKGIPEEEIAFMQDANTELQKETLFKSMRAGKVRVLIGSTQTCGVGLCVQNRLIALHHIDCPWRPGDIEQREGRIIRQGNGNKEVYIFRYVTEGTFDGFMWSTIERKAKFINQIMTEDVTERECSDCDENVLNYAEISAIATGNPKIREKMETDILISKLKLLKNAWKKSKFAYESDITNLPEQILTCEESLEYYKKDLDIRAEHTQYMEDGKKMVFKMMLNGVLYKERKDAGNYILSRLKEKDTYNKILIGSYCGFDLYVRTKYTMVQEVVKEVILLGPNQTRYIAEVETDPLGTVYRIENLLKTGPEKAVATYEEKLRNLKERLEYAIEKVEEPFEQEEELRAAIERVAVLNAELAYNDTEVYGSISDEA